MKIKFLIFSFFTIFSFISNDVWAQNNEGYTDTILINFFHKLDVYGVDSSVNYFNSTNNHLLEDTSTAMAMKKYFKNFYNKVGAYFGYEVLNKKRTGDYYITYVLLVRFERQPMRFTFSFYKADSQWKGFNLKFDDKIFAEIDESIKIK